MFVYNKMSTNSSGSIIIPTVETNYNLPVYTVDNISLNKISINLGGNLYVNVDLNYTVNSDGFPSVSHQPIYIYGKEFINVINVQKLLLTVTQLFGLEFNQEYTQENPYKYVPQSL
jgi:hypothetical protein